MTHKQPGQYMASEAAEALGVFCETASLDVSFAIEPLALGDVQSYYTIARGSSDAAANILSYEMMRETGMPVTSLPPSVFSVGQGVKCDQSAIILISQSGASDDLVLSAKGAAAKGAKILAITNQDGSAVETAADLRVPIGAGPEMAVPATKTVIGSIAAGIALLSALAPCYRERSNTAVAAMRDISTTHPLSDKLSGVLQSAEHVYVIGRDTSYGAAQEVALKLKECCALHAEAHSSAEVLHGPLQLATNRLTVLILDCGASHIQKSLDESEQRFKAVGCEVFRIKPSDIGATGLTPAAAAALLLAMIYPIVLDTALALNFDPDAPATLSKVTQTT